MYETRLVGSGGKAGGLAGLGGGARGPLDIVLNGTVGLLLIYLAFTIIEPFWTSAMDSSRQVKMGSDMKVLSDAFNRYRLKKGAYRGEDLRDLRDFLSTIPRDPWGNDYRVDPLFRRIISGGANGQIDADLDSEAGRDDQIFFYRHPWILRVVIEQAGQPVPFEVRIDGGVQEPVAGEFPQGTEEIAEDQQHGLVVAARAGDRSLDIARAVPGGAAPVWLATGPGRDGSPGIQAEEGMVYFDGIRDAPKPLIYRVPIGGGAVEAVTSVPDSFEVPFWEGDHAPSLSSSGHLAFHARRLDTEVDRICVIAKGRPGGKAVILKAPLPAGILPQWSADGKTIAYLSSDRTAVERIPFPPRGKVKSARIALGGPATSFRHSPDGEYLAVLYQRGAGTHLEIRSLDSGRGRVILEEASRIYSVGWKL